MISRSLAALAVICATASAHAQNYSSEDLVRRTIERRAVEAMNWGMSAVNTELMLQEMLNKTAGNTVLRFIEPCLPSPADRPPSG